MVSKIFLNVCTINPPHTKKCVDSLASALPLYPTGALCELPFPKLPSFAVLSKKIRKQRNPEMNLQICKPRVCQVSGFAGRGLESACFRAAKEEVRY